MKKRYLSVREYAAFFGVSIATVYGMCTQGLLPHVRLGVGRGTIRIPVDTKLGNVSVSVPTDGRVLRTSKS